MVFLNSPETGSCSCWRCWSCGCDQPADRASLQPHVVGWTAPEPGSPCLSITQQQQHQHRGEAHAEFNSNWQQCFICVLQQECNTRTLKAATDSLVRAMHTTVAERDHSHKDSFMWSMTVTWAAAAELNFKFQFVAAAEWTERKAACCGSDVCSYPFHRRWCNLSDPEASPGPETALQSDRPAPCMTSHIQHHQWGLWDAVSTDAQIYMIYKSLGNKTLWISFSL